LARDGRWLRRRLLGARFPGPAATRAEIHNPSVYPPSSLHSTFLSTVSTLPLFILVLVLFRAGRPFFLIFAVHSLHNFSNESRPIMKFTLSLAALAVSVSLSSAAPIGHSKRDVDPSLIPQFGFSAGVNPTGELSSHTAAPPDN
jgi:hypothetical protein